MGTRIILTGGAGFIGSALLWRLNQAGEERILVVDSLGRGEKWRNLVGLRFADYQEKDDFLARVETEGLPAGVETVFHLGACSSTTEPDVRYLLKNNFEYTRTLAACSLAAGARFIYASSAATYGDGRRGWVDTEEEIDQLRPLNQYGYSKHLFDLWALRQGWLKQMVGLKFFNVYGPNEYHKGTMRSMVARGFEQIQAEGRLRLFRSERSGWADGEQERDFLYIHDALEMMIFIYRHLALSGIYNLGSGQARTWNDLAAALFAALGMEPQVEYIPLPAEIRKNYQYRTEAVMSKLRDAGYHHPPTPLEDAIGDYVCNYLLPGRYLAETELTPGGDRPSG